MATSFCYEKVRRTMRTAIVSKHLTKRVLETTAQLITSTRRKNSQSNYNSPWRMWASWCDKQQVDAFQCDVIKVLDYLAFLLEKLYEYRTIGCHRSAMSAFYDFVDGKPVGQHPEACALVSGIFNNRPPPQPRYVFAWNVESVINHIKTKWKNNENLSEKCLVILIALTSASRASGMHCLYVRFMIKSEDDYFFIFHKLQSKAQPKLYFNKKPKDLCLVFP